MEHGRADWGGDGAGLGTEAPWDTGREYAGGLCVFYDPAKGGVLVDPSHSDRDRAMQRCLGEMLHHSPAWQGARDRLLPVLRDRFRGGVVQLRVGCTSLSLGRLRRLEEYVRHASSDFVGECLHEGSRAPVCNKLLFLQDGSRYFLSIGLQILPRDGISLSLRRSSPRRPRAIDPTFLVSEGIDIVNEGDAWPHYDPRWGRPAQGRFHSFFLDLIQGVVLPPAIDAPYYELPLVQLGELFHGAFLWSRSEWHGPLTEDYGTGIVHCEVQRMGIEMPEEVERKDLGSLVDDLARSLVHRIRERQEWPVAQRFASQKKERRIAWGGVRVRLLCRPSEDLQLDPCDPPAA